MPSNDLKDEYSSLNENMRWYSNIRFAQLTLFIGLTAGLLAVVFTSNPPLSHAQWIILNASGIVATVFFWLMEERAAEYWRHFLQRAVELEKELGYKQYSTRPQHRVNTTHILRGFFAIAILLWTISLLNL
jgi:membrane associated rhomboid family serine protease